MRVLVINVGSSSVKFGVFDMASGHQRLKEQLSFAPGGVDAALRGIPAALARAGEDHVDAVGHRIAHGGTRFLDATLIDESVLAAVEQFSPLAPLHNPPALAGIRAFMRCWPDAPQVAVFDTAFHSRMPEHATTYAVPLSWREAGVRRYGFHGTSHKYVMEHVADALAATPAELRIISCHLGNGASMCAIDRGISVDTSMGMTSLEGLVMGTRSGDVDPGVFAYLHSRHGMSPEAIEGVLYSRAGLSALSGLGNDLRVIEAAAADGDPRAQLALNVFAYRARKYVGAFAAAMGGFDVLAFTGGIGENSASMRRRICDRLQFMGLYLDDDKNASVSLDNYAIPQIQQSNSRVRVMVTETREQWMIAREVHRLLRGSIPASNAASPGIPIAVSAHHAHLTQAAVESLFGPGHSLTKLRDLSQPGGWAAVETVDVVGPRGRLKNLRVLGPCRSANQIEISTTESFALGLDVPVRISGDIKDTPTVVLEGPAVKLTTDGVIVAQRHIHMHPVDGQRLKLGDRDTVDVVTNVPGRATVLRDVVVRISPDFRLEMHIDTDEANAASVPHGGDGELTGTECFVNVTRCRPAMRCCHVATDPDATAAGNLPHPSTPCPPANHEWIET